MTRLFNPLEQYSHHQKQLVKSLQSDLKLVDRAMDVSTNTPVVTNALIAAWEYLSKSLEKETYTLLQFREEVGRGIATCLRLDTWFNEHASLHRHRKSVVVHAITNDDWMNISRKVFKSVEQEGYIFRAMSVGHVVDLSTALFENIQHDICKGRFPKGQPFIFTFLDFHSSADRELINRFIDHAHRFAARVGRQVIIILPMYSTNIITPRKNLIII